MRLRTPTETKDVPELISIIVTTYNREDALAAVLSALSRQADRNFEVVVADDGSGPATAALIESWKPRLGVPLTHVWQVDWGFRAAEIRNRAVLGAGGDYCVFLDGDCIARPDFVAAHRRLAEPGWFVTGNRVLLSPALTAAVLRDRLQPQAWGFTEWIGQRASIGSPRCCDCRLGRCASCNRGNGWAPVPAISASGGPISSGSTDSMRASAAGGVKIPISWCGSSMPACAARTGALRPVSFTCGTGRRTARN
jgi:glycosyltransferase involved in cell wall biosynthesis